MQSFRGGTVNDFVPLVRMFSFWICESRWRQGKVLDPGGSQVWWIFPLFLLKLMGCEILSPFYLACDPEGWCLSGQLLDAPLTLSVLSRYHAFNILVFKSSPATRANISSFLVLRLNSNTESWVQPRSLEPSSKIYVQARLDWLSSYLALKSAATSAKRVWKRWRS